MKKAHILSHYLMITGICFWFLETVTFLILDGWHYKATTPTEIICDTISEVLVKLGITIWIFSAAYVINKIYKSL